MAAFLFGLFGAVGACLLVAVWFGLDMMFGFGFSEQAAQGLLLVGGAGGFLLGGVLTFIFD